MPKIKTKKGAAKRFKRTASGQLKRSHAFASKLKVSKTRRHKRRLRKATMVARADLKQMRRLLPG